MQINPGCARNVMFNAGLLDKEQARSVPHCSAQSLPGERKYSELLKERMKEGRGSARERFPLTHVLQAALCGPLEFLRFLGPLPDESCDLSSLTLLQFIFFPPWPYMSFCVSHRMAWPKIKTLGVCQDPSSLPTKRFSIHVTSIPWAPAQPITIARLSDFAHGDQLATGLVFRRPDRWQEQAPRGQLAFDQQDCYLRSSQQVELQRH